MNSRFKTRHSARVHFVGIGGTGMCGIAEVLVNLGYVVSGSDMKRTEVTERLQALGAVVSQGHRKENLKEADVVVVSSAIKRDNPEVLAAREAKIPVIPRAEMLAELMRLKYAIAIAGSHGKTTTTSMVATVMNAAGLDPTVVVGGKVNVLGSNAKLGRSTFMVAEADESDGSFLRLYPSIAVVTNIDAEHLEHYHSLDTLKEAFITFCNSIPFYGLNVLCLDHPNVQSLLPKIEKRVVTYGTAQSADYHLSEVRLDGFLTHFKAARRGDSLGEFSVKMVGAHNALNAMAMIAIADELDIPLETVRKALKEFEGVQRRFTVRGEEKGIAVVDDYGHHPEEIKATLRGAKEAFKRRVVVAFQPHRYTRTRDLLKEFACAFNDADVLVLLPIYAAGEEAIPGISSAFLGQVVAEHGHKEVVVASSQEEAIECLCHCTQAGDMVLTLGAGSITQLGPMLLERLRGVG
ncbi:MAG: UDP-N-acetylmuramate--L-alanine ligase [Cystobacterineae bacterium]|nr:UDP-N-acetylmuramate--L-alanine ligase [Cystobacterineae bacterium]